MNGTRQQLPEPRELWNVEGVLLPDHLSLRRVFTPQNAQRDHARGMGTGKVDRSGSPRKSSSAGREPRQRQGSCKD